MMRAEIDIGRESSWDYWVLRTWRDAAATTLFVVAPVLQIASPRWLPLAVLLALLFLFFGHVLTRFRHAPPINVNQILDLSGWSTGLKLVAFVYAAFLAWVGFSLFWSPMPLLGTRDLLLLIVAPLISLYLAHESARTTIAPLANILVVGMVVSAVLLVLECGGYTQLHRVASSQNGIPDLNRSAVLLCLLLAPLAMAHRAKAIATPTVIATAAICVAAIFWSQSESAKLMVILFAATWSAITLLPALHPYICAAMGMTVLVFPLMLKPIDKVFTEVGVPQFTVGSVQPEYDEARTKYAEAARHFTILRRQSAVGDSDESSNPLLGGGTGNSGDTAEDKLKMLDDAQQKMDEAKTAFEQAREKKRQAHSFGFATSRLAIWKSYWDLASESPYVGFGQRANRYYGSAGSDKHPTITHPHPHNVSLELWTDHGMIGTGLFALLLAGFGFATKNINRRLLPAVTALAAAAFSHAMTGAGFLQGWYIAGIIVAAVAVITMINSPQLQPT